MKKCGRGGYHAVNQPVFFPLPINILPDLSLFFQTTTVVCPVSHKSPSTPQHANEGDSDFVVSSVMSAGLGDQAPPRLFVFSILEQPLENLLLCKN